MGKKSKAPAAPDYGPLAAASQKSAEYSFQLAQRQQDWAEKTYADNKAVSDIVIDKALGALDKQEADADRREHATNTCSSRLRSNSPRTPKLSSRRAQEVEAGKAEADVAAQFEQARQTAAERLEGYGVDPSQTRQGALDLGTRIAEAAAQASAGNQARTQTENIGEQLRSKAINVGHGYPGQINASMAGAGAVRQPGYQHRPGDDRVRRPDDGHRQGWQGPGNQALTSWGNILNQGYQNQLAQYQANQELVLWLGVNLGPSPALSWAGQPGRRSAAASAVRSASRKVAPYRRTAA